MSRTKERESAARLLTGAEELRDAIRRHLTTYHLATVAAEPDCRRLLDALGAFCRSATRAAGADHPGERGAVRCSS